MPHDGDEPASASPRRTRWTLLADGQPLQPAEGLRFDRALVREVTDSQNEAFLRVWQPDREVLIASSGEDADEAVTMPGGLPDLTMVQRDTPGPQWYAPGTAVILWTVVARPTAFVNALGAGAGEPVAEWVLSTLRQSGLQASISEADQAASPACFGRRDGTIRTPMGTIGFWAKTTIDDVVLAQGIVDYAITPAQHERSDGVETENIRSQSGLPLPLILDRFARMARTLYRAAPQDPRARLRRDSM